MDGSQKGRWFFLMVAMFVGAAAEGCSQQANKLNEKGEAVGPVKLLNVSYDPTRELWKQLNTVFIENWNKDNPEQPVSIDMSHGGSGSQARTVIDGLDADVVTLAMWADTNAVSKAGLIAEGWEERLPNNSLPYSSTLVFVVRKGNPKQIKEWADLVKPDVQIITPNPKTSGNGKLSFLAAWGSVINRGGSESEALELVTKLYQQVPVLDSGARGATATFAQKGIGDVHLTWENEAHLEVAESKGNLELVYPSQSILAEPRVALVDKYVDKKGSRKIAQAYLDFLYTPEAQEVIAKNFYRPSDAEVLEKHSSTFKPIELFKITKIANSWEDADNKFFGENGVFDSIYGEQASK